MSSELTPLLLLVVLLVVFWLVVLRPARNQQRTQQALQRSLEVGDDVVLSAGIFGTVTAIDDAQVHLEVAPGTVLRVARQVIVRRVEDEPAAPAVADVEDESAPVTSETPTDEPVTATTAPSKKSAKKSGAKSGAKVAEKAPATTTEPAPEPEDAERG